MNKHKEKNLIHKKYGKGFKDHLLEQYKIYVDTADKISSRRDISNNFYLALNSAMFAITGYLSFLNKSSISFVVLPIIGIVISVWWLKTIKAYSSLNSGKFKVIHELEEYLPAALFRHEWDILGKGKTKAYRPLTKLERGVPITFIILYIALIGIIILFPSL